ncbi:MAG: hypothetical protein E5V44_08290, partial [Mesorhizobium sp.]
MVQAKQLRDWKPGRGSPTSGLSERRAFLPRHAARRTEKYTGVLKMKKIVLTAAALLAISGSAFAGGSDHY